VICQRADHGRRTGPSELARHPGAGLHDGAQVDAVLDPQTGEEPHEVLGGEVARGALGVGAAAEAAGGGIVRRHAGLEPRVDVGEGLAVGVVEVEREP
jgi:hypothetical protein